MACAMACLDHELQRTAQGEWNCGSEAAPSATATATVQDHIMRLPFRLLADRRLRQQTPASVFLRGKIKKGSMEGKLVFAVLSVHKQTVSLF